MRAHDELFVVGASLGTKKKRSLMHNAEYDLIAPRIATEYDLWSRGTKLYY